MADSTVALKIDGFTPAAEAVAPILAEAPTEEQDQERALVIALRAGEQDAYETLIELYEQPIFSIVSRVMDQADDASDVTQEVFLKVFRKIDAFRGESSLKTWIYRIAVNEAHNHRRWFGRHRRQEVALDPDDGRKGVRDLVADRGPSPYEIARDQETHALIENALKRISVQYRAALVLREVEGLRYEEIAEILEISLGTVKSRILRGREALRKVLSEDLERSHAHTPMDRSGGDRSRIDPGGSDNAQVFRPEAAPTRSSGLQTEVARSAVRVSGWEPSTWEGSQWYER